MIKSQTEKRNRRETVTMIKREYKSKSDCVNFFINEDFDSFPSWVVTDTGNGANEYWFEYWSFKGKLDDEEQGEEYGYVDVPMWNTWFIPRDSANIHWIETHEKETMDCGFTLIYNEGELFALGVDGCGYSFADTHFAALYDAQGLKWHDED